MQVTESLKLANIDKDGKIDYREFTKVHSYNLDIHIYTHTCVYIRIYVSRIRKYRQGWQDRKNREFTKVHSYNLDVHIYTQTYTHTCVYTYLCLSNWQISTRMARSKKP